MKINLSHINTVTRYRSDGTTAVYRYHRPTGLRLMGEPGTAEFMVSYSSVVAAVPHHSRLNGIIKRYIKSQEYRSLSATTKMDYSYKHKIIKQTWGGTHSIEMITVGFRRRVLEWRDEKAMQSAAQADRIVGQLSRLISFAVDRGLMDRNVLARIRKVYHPDRADKIWLPGHIGLFEGAASPELYAAMMLALHTGQRKNDLLRLPWSAFDGARITLTQSKTRRRVSILCTKPLLALLTDMARAKAGPLILNNEAGIPWNGRRFNEAWNKVQKAVGIEDLHFHDLRGTAVTMLGEAGCTVPEIAAVTGHNLRSVHDILEQYLSRTRSLADAAIIKLDDRRERMEKAQ